MTSVTGTTAGAVNTVVNQPAVGLPPTIQVTTNVYLEKDKKEKEKSGSISKGLYYMAEGLVHFGLITHCTRDIYYNCSSSPMYIYTYVTALVAGASFAHYKRTLGSEETAGLEKRAIDFDKGSLIQKAKMATAILATGPFALQTLERVFVSPYTTLGSLVPVWWGFSLGADLTRLAYDSMKIEKSKGNNHGNST